MKNIPIADVRFSELSLMDDVGKVFFWNGRVFRAISESAVDSTKKLLESGLLEDLFEKNLIPHTVVSDFKFEGLSFVIEHERIPYQTYPFEWSFEMLRSAGLLVLEIASIAGKYGYALKDCHPYNILFNGSDPVYVDIGSLFRLDKDCSFFPSDEYLTHYIAPLSIWSYGDEYLARQCLAHLAAKPMPFDSWRIYNRTFFKRARSNNHHIFNRMERFLERAVNLFANKFPGDRLIDWVLLTVPESFRVGKVSVLKKKTFRIPAFSGGTPWSNYHDQYTSVGGKICTPRFEKIIKIVKRLNPESVVDLAANQGILGFFLIDRTSVKRVVCVDRDSMAIDKLFMQLKAMGRDLGGRVLQPVLSDLINNSALITQPPLPTRLRGNLVAALAMTHHLLLGQGLELSDVFRRIAGFTNRYAIIEFMPLGLWDGNAAPAIPSHYNLEWFKAGFVEFFNLLDLIALEENRIALVGELKKLSLE